MTIPVTSSPIRVIKRGIHALFAAVLPLSLLFAPGGVQANDDIVVYSSRNTQLIEPIFDAYSRETGNAISFITAGAGELIQRLDAEGALTKADVFLTVDVGMLWRAAEKGLLAPVESRTLRKNVPAHLRDTDGRWFGLSRRARVIVYASDRVDASELDSYRQLAEPQWKNRLCLTSGKEVYNQSLIAVLMERYGESDTEAMLKGWLSNLAARPFASDTAVLQAIEAGQCDVGIVNSYYFGRMQHNDPTVPIRIFWPDQGAGGVHENISGAAVTLHAPNPNKALDLVEWMSTREAQVLFAGLNMEYPVNPKVRPVRPVAKWGRFQSDERPIDRIGPLLDKATRLMLKAGYL